MPGGVPTPTAELNRSQYSEALRRALWGLRRLRRRLAAWTGPESIPDDRTLSDAVRLVAEHRDARNKLDRAARYTAQTLGADWERLIDGHLPKYSAVAAKVAAIAGRIEGPAVLAALNVALHAALEAGHDALEAETDWRMMRAQDELDYWTRWKEIAELPGNVLAAIVRSAATVARAATEGGLSALFSALKPILPYAAAAVGAYFLLGRGKG